MSAAESGDRAGSNQRFVEPTMPMIPNAIDVGTDGR